MKKPAIYVAIVLVLVLSAAPFSHSLPVQFGRSKEPQDHTRTLTGHVLDRHDDPIPRAIVYLKNTKSLAVKTYITEANGSYHFPALSPNADYEVYAEHHGARSDTKTLSAFDNRKLVNYTLHIRE
jgi:protocatechuate 3,4-dioxygenase beta subunit